MKIALSVFLLTILCPALASTFELKADNLHFHYQPAEFEGADCTHEQVRDLPDWKVVCKSRYHDKEFGVHLVARKYRSKDPALSKFEVLYWVSNRFKAENRNEHTGTSLNFTVREDVKPYEIRIGQMVDKGIAELEMTIDLK